MVDGTSWFKCTATYGGHNYDAYWTVDQSDPVQSYTYKTLVNLKMVKVKVQFIQEYIEMEKNLILLEV